MSKYQTLSHEKFIIRYHLIFSTKYRKKLLAPIRDDILCSIQRASSLWGHWKVVVAEIDKDHIHLLVEASPTDRISEIVHTLKQTSTYDIWHSHYEYMRQFYWKQHHLWTKGYFVSTIGDVSEKILKQYIENQG